MVLSAVKKVEKTTDRSARACFDLRLHCLSGSVRQSFTSEAITAMRKAMPLEINAVFCQCGFVIPTEDSQFIHTPANIVMNYSLVQSVSCGVQYKGIASNTISCLIR